MPGAPQTRSRVAFGAGAILALLGALGAAELATAGVASDPTTTVGDIIVRGDAGALSRLGVTGASDGAVLTAANGVLSYTSPLPSTAGASDGGVLTVAGGAVQWAAASGALPTASGAGEMLVSDGAGTAYTATAAATVRASLDATRVTTPDLSSSSGWTITALNAGSGAISGGAFTSTIPAGTTSGTGSTARRAYTYAPQWELQGRVEITADTAGELLAGLTAVWSGGVLSLYVRGSGAFYLYQEGSWGFAGLTIAGSGFPVDGTGWVRLRVTGARVQAWSGIGSGSTPPTAWTLRADTTMSVAIGAAQPVSVQVSGFSNDGHSVPSGTTVVWRSVTLTSLAGASL